jgi:hypothetical protein
MFHCFGQTLITIIFLGIHHTDGLAHLNADLGGCMRCNEASRLVFTLLCFRAFQRNAPLNDKTQQYLIADNITAL